MFEGDLTTLVTADLLESAAAHRAEANRLDARLLEHAQLYADHHHPDACTPHPTRHPRDGRERAVVLGGDGCPEIAEFAPAEFGAVLGISPGAAADFIGQALALRHRLPFTWARVQAGEATPWRARKIATACLDLSLEAAGAVDRRVAKVVDSLTPGRLDKIVEAAKKHADPEAARAKAEEKARERGVYLGRSDEHGTKKIYIRTATGAAIRFDARLTSIAEALKILGDTASLQRRRADAVGIIADPRYTEELLHQAHEHLRTTTPPEPPPPTHTDPPSAPTTPTTTPNTTHRSPDGSRPPSAQKTGASTDPGTAPDTRAGTNQSTGASTAWGVASTADPATDQRGAPTTGLGSAPGSGPVIDSATTADQRGTPTTGPGSAPGSGPVIDSATTADQRGTPTIGPGSAPGPGPVIDSTSTADQRGAPTTGRGSPPAADPVVNGETTTADLPPAPATAPPPAPARAAKGDADRGSGRNAGRALHGGRGRDSDDCGGWSGDDRLLIDWGEPGPEDEADRDAPYPGDSELPDPLDAPYREAIEPFEPGLRTDDTDGEPLDAAARRVLDARLAQIRRDAHTDPGSGRAARPGRTEVYVHLTDQTLATGSGVLRAETIGPLLATQLAELIGHGPYTVKPVIDLNDAVSVDAYEIPDRIRERTRLTHPVELFPYGSRETHPAMDLDHIQPYDPLGPPGQTSTSNLVPLRRFPHRIKTHGRWQVRRLDPRTLEWTTPNGFTFHVDPTGTHPAPHPHPDT